MSRLTLGTIALALAAAGCGSTPTTATPTPTAITDTYQGTLNQNGADRFSFVTAQSGVTVATLSAITPTDMVVGLALGTFNPSLGSCQVVLANDKAGLNAAIQGQSDRAGNLCVRIYDVGNVTSDPVSYKIQVVHY